MPYVKSSIPERDLDTLRVNLSVRQQKYSPEPCCDFCGDPHPVARYAAHTMSTGVKQPAWRWLACAVCEQAVDTDDWAAIRERMLPRLRAMLPPALSHITAEDLRAAANGSIAEFRRDVARTE